MADEFMMTRRKTTMQMIKDLERNIHCEYEDANKYIKLALENKDTGDT